MYKFGLAAICFVIAMFIGWVINIVELVQMENLDWSGEVIVRAIGIVVFPIGSIMGWFV